MKKLLLLILLIPVSGHTQSPTFIYDHAVILNGAVSINKIDGNFSFTTMGVYHDSLVLPNSPASMNGAVAELGGLIATFPNLPASILDSSGNWGVIPNIIDAHDVMRFEDSLLVFTSSNVYYGPGSPAVLPIPPFSLIGYDPIVIASGTLYPFVMTQVAENGHDFVMFHAGACTDLVVGNLQNNTLSLRVVGTQYRHHNVVDADNTQNSIDYVATTVLIGSGGVMSTKFMSIDQSDSVHVYTELDRGVMIATIDSVRTVFASEGHFYTIFPGTNTVNQEGKSVSIFNKVTNTLEDLFDLENADVADVEFRNDTLRVGINPTPPGALVILEDGTILGPFNEPSVVYFTLSTPTGVVQGDESVLFAVLYDPTSYISAYAEGTIVIYNLTGQMLKRIPVEGGDKIFTDELSSGMYLVTFLDQNNADRHAIKFVKR
jgi:hypothetical protein